MKTKSTFFGQKMRETVRENVTNLDWARKMQEEVCRDAETLLTMSDDEIWALMIPHTIHRSWMVWSDGYCPDCGQDVRMYFWRHDPDKHPWKVACPHCGSLFPKNDFKRFLESGMDEKGNYSRDRADESILYNEEEPDGERRNFGVDDGDGYCEGGKRWRFIGNYLIYSRWKQQIVGGLKALSTAYFYTGDMRYAHKAGILLDRVSDVLKDFDFDQEGLVYEMPHTAEGYVSYCIDSTTEMKEIVLAYDRVFEAIKEDQELVNFLKKKGDNKESFAQIQTDIENGILKEVLAHPEKIRSNPPHTELTQLVIKSVLGCSEEELIHDIGVIIENNTECDGVQGEKGLARYSAMCTKGLALLLTEFLDYNDGFFDRLLKQYPVLHKTFRFHIDTWCLRQHYYPGTGDGGRFARPDENYYAIDFQDPRMFTLMWELSKATGDRDFLKIMYKENGNSAEGLPHDIRVRNSKEIEHAVEEWIRQEGTVIRLSSVNKEKFCIGILREEEEKYAVWMDYAYCGGHAQSAGMTIGMYAKGLDLMPDFGYPPVMYGGWQTPQALWYRLPSAHNTVMVDGRYQRNNSRGKTTLFETGKAVQAIRVDGRNIADIPQFERTLLMIPIDSEEFYAVDSFKVVGGKDHAKFTYSGFGKVITGGLNLSPVEDYGHGSLINQTVGDAFPETGYWIDWKIVDQYHMATADDVHFRYTDFTYHTTAAIGSAWICTAEYSGENMLREEAHIPVAISRRKIENGLMLTSNFVSVLEAYAGKRNIKSIRRLEMAYPNGIVCSDIDSFLEVTLENGAIDLIVQLDVDDVIYNKFCKDRVVTQSEWKYESDAEIMKIRIRDGQVEEMFACGLTFVNILGEMIPLPQHMDCVEWKRMDGRLQIIRQKESRNYVQANY